MSIRADKLLRIWYINLCRSSSRNSGVIHPRALVAIHWPVRDREEVLSSTGLADPTSSRSPASIRDYTAVVKAVVASAIDENGEEMFPRKWNEEYIDAPIVRDQHQPTATAEGIQEIFKAASGQLRVLYALLSGTGPLRVGEALGLELNAISSDFRTLTIRQKAKRGIIQPFLKTEAGEREVDLCEELATMLRDFVGTRTEGLLFCTKSASNFYSQTRSKTVFTLSCRN
jgi:integrase